MFALLLLLTTTALAKEPGKEARVVNVYNWADYIGPTTLADFEKETGIKVNYDTYDSSEIVDAKLLAGSTGYDVVVHSGQYSSRLIPLGIFRTLDREKLPHWKGLDPVVVGKLAEYDPGNVHAAPFMWGTTGFAYNREMIRKIMPDAPVASGAMIFDPDIVKHFAKCGVSFLDSPTDMVPMALVYLGKDANSVDPNDILAAERLLKSVRRYIKYFSSTLMLQDLPNEEVCIAVSWSGDYATARARARDAGIDIDLAYTVPAEGSIFWFDAMLIPSDAPHPDNAHRLVDFMLRPDVLAAITNYTSYANPVPASQPLLDPAVRSDPAVYPPQEVIDRLQMTYTLPPKQERLRTRAWAHAKTGM
jgi:putrescine transport system substrate-binding protein